MYTMIHDKKASFGADLFPKLKILDLALRFFAALRMTASDVLTPCITTCYTLSIGGSYERDYISRAGFVTEENDEGQN